MYLKALDVVGFKSFANPTKIEFHRGVTVVVGPNGCGKSNVLDAIRWVLGEQSAKALRGGSMQDVIFSGTDSKRAVGMAEVSMTFAECEDQLGTDYNEVRITRRVFRDGRGEYEINKTPCRLKDIHRIFMDTGIGRSAYSIMEQGKIDQILSSKPEERRAVFEEAAGITRFKSQKKEALRKLEATEANLLRVTDIIKEVTRQIGSLQRQASKARRYKESFERLKFLDTRLAVHQYEEIKTVLDEGTERVAAIQKEFEELQKGLEEKDAVVRQKRIDLENVDYALKDVEQQKLASENRVASCRQEINFSEERINELDTLKERNRLDISSNEEKQKTQQEQLDSINQELASVDSDLAALSDAVNEAKERMNVAKRSVEENLQKRSEIDAELSKCDEGINTSKNKLAAIELQQRSFSVRVEKLEEEENLAQERVNQIDEKFKNLTSLLEGKKQAQRNLENTSSEKEKETEVLEEKLESSKEEREEAAQTLSQLEAQISAIKHLLEAHAGFSSTTQKLLEKFKGQGISGTLLDMIEVSPGYEKAVQIALGEALEALVVDQAESFSQIIDELGQEGSAVFASDQLTSFRAGYKREKKEKREKKKNKRVEYKASSSLQEEKKKEPEGAMRRFMSKLSSVFSSKKAPATDSQNTVTPERSSIEKQVVSASDAPEKENELKRFVTPDKTVQGLVERLLEDYLVVSSIDDANDFRKRFSEYNVVTKEGEVIYREGWLVRGNQENEKQSILVQENKLKELLVQLPELEKKAEDTKQAYENFKKEFLEKEKGLKECLAEKQKVDGEVSALSYEHQGMERQKEECLNQLEVIQKERVHLSEQDSTDVEEQKRLKEDIEKFSQQKTEQAARLESLIDELKGFNEKVEAVSQEVTESRIKEASVKQRQESIVEQKTTISNRVEELAEAIKQRQEEIEDYDRKIVQCRETIVTSQESIQVAEGKIGELSADLEKRREERALIQKVVEEVEEEARTERNKTGELQSQLSSAEVKVAEKKMHFNALLERIQRAYGLDLTNRQEVLAALKAQREEEEKKEEEAAEETSGEEQNQEVSSGEEQEIEEGKEEIETTGEEITAEGEEGEIAEGTLEEEAIDAETEELEEESEEEFVLEELDWEEVEQEVMELREKIDRMGPVNVEAITEYEELEERAVFLQKQEEDLTKSREQLHEAIKKINQTTKTMFAETFEQIQKNFSEMFVELFGGGKAQLDLQDESDPLESGIDIIARPPGKQLQSISLLSGGERTMTAVSLLFAIYMVKPSPFCFLDEMDAPLDESNISRFIKILQRFREQSQFCVISHNKRTISSADVLYGVTMQEHGISKIVSVKLARKDEDPLFNQEEEDATPSIADSVRSQPTL